jgi:phospholipid/cholesterol/gamma-HCH transport system substrate-binding protein
MENHEESIMRERSGVEMKVGLVTLVGLILLSILVFSIGDYDLLGRKRSVHLIFNFAGGVEASAPVRLAGVKVGDVKRLRLIANDEGEGTAVDIEVWIDQNIQIREDAEIYINSLGVLGEKYVEIIDPGVGRVVEPGGTVQGSDPVPIERLTHKAQDIVDELDDLLKHLNDVVGDEEVKNSFKNTLHHMEGTFGNTEDITEKIRLGEGSLGQLINNDSLYTELDAFAKEIRRNPWKLLKKPGRKKGDKKVPVGKKRNNFTN